MRLSEAIRLGATMKAQTFGRLFDGGKSCAWGAAYDAIGETQGYRHYQILQEQGWEALAQHTFVLCPVCGRKDHVQNTIVDLNNTHRWTRERIADWVELQEGPTAPEELPDPIPQPEEEPVKVA